ncbi:MAG: FAD-dependent oxidoreductase [Clostridiales Family XIII bacterium]|jgi:2,4-dienoyl-CoA reductase-like NADH-dependent reductase (Old Yellow Enzyme family)/thioredoxin reductase|nr:FAD-dependent oxidoreductase [Clostridiales Family XIII bacterium]
MYEKLFTPITIRGITLRNRIVSAPNQTRFKCGIESLYMERKACGGAAVVTIGESPVNECYARQSPEYTFNMNVATDVRFMGETASAIARHGAIAAIQLYHPGNHAIGHSGKSKPPTGPVGYTREDGTEVIAMDEDAMQQTIEDFSNAAVVAKRAGFEMIQVQSGHGWLLNQFLSPRTNKRTDRYGGGTENRMRFPLEVLRGIRQRAGWDFILEIRVSGEELLPGGMSIEEVSEYVSAAEDYIDVVNISAGVHEAKDTVCRQFAHSGFTPHGVNRYLSERIKKSGTRALVSVVGGISTPALAEEILVAGQADLIAMARALIADPDFPNKACRGKADEIVPCLRCNNCLLSKGESQTLRCAVNPKAGVELHVQLSPSVRNSKNVVIVGGGPAGMEAAITAGERGHKVTLFEASEGLGGVLKISDCADPLKEDMRTFKNYLIRKVFRNSRVDVRLRTAGTTDNIAKLNPDAIVVAVGGTPIKPNIQGIDGDNILNGMEAYEKIGEIGDSVVVVGGGLVGCEVALNLAEHGKKVTIVEMRDKLGDPVDWRHSLPLLARLDENENIEILTKAQCVAVANGNPMIAIGNGDPRAIPADAIIMAVGIRPLSDTVRAFRKLAPWFRAVGDCNRPGRIMQAVRDGFWAGMDIL